jgi:hypothetical protein
VKISDSLDLSIVQKRSEESKSYQWVLQVHLTPRYSEGLGSSMIVVVHGYVPPFFISSPGHHQCVAGISKKLYSLPSRDVQVSLKKSTHAT